MKRLAAAAAALTLLLTACGPDLGSGRTACQLITKADIQKTIPEMNPTNGLANGTSERSDCYFTDAEKRADGVQVSVDIDRTAGDSAMQRDRTRAERSPDFEVANLPGLGEEAFLIKTRDGFAATVESRVGDSVLVVHISGSTAPEAQTQSLSRIGISRS